MPKSMSEGFASFLSNLQPLASEHDKATSHKNSVQSCLVSNFECTNFFETGSFGSNTGIRHYSDTDYFAVIPSKNLKQDSSLSLRAVKDALIVKFWNTVGIAVKCPAVSVPFGFWASETMEISPCCFSGLKEYDGRSFQNYEIADCNGGWMNSSPTAHNYYVKKTDDALSYKVKPLIQLMKAWKYYNNVPISSFFLEIYVTRFCASEKSVDYSYDLRTLLKNLESNSLPGMYDPVGISGLIKPCSSDTRHEDALSKVKTAASRAGRAQEYITAGNLDKAFETYDLLFNKNFPAR